MKDTAFELPSLTDDVLATMNLTREAWDRIRAMMAERETRTPAVGAFAADFELPLMSKRDRTVRLSDFRGRRPVALIFGSYT